MFWYRTRILGDVVAKVGRDRHDGDQQPQQEEEERRQSCPKGSDSSATKSEIHWVIDVQEDEGEAVAIVNEAFCTPPRKSYSTTPVL